MTERHPQRQLHTEHRRAASVMSNGRSTPTEPSYFRTLAACGLIPKSFTFAEAFAVWVRVCVDPVVLAAEKKLRQKHPNTFNNSKNVCTHKAVQQIAESDTELAELKKRIERKSDYQEGSDHAADVLAVART
jgi:hypothetical protein